VFAGTCHTLLPPGALDEQLWADAAALSQDENLFIKQQETIQIGKTLL
jgi:hypothetical protein